MKNKKILPYTFVKPSLSDEMKKWYDDNQPDFPLMCSNRFIFVSEVTNCPGHCIILDPRSGKILPGVYHTSDFVLIEEDEV